MYIRNFFLFDVFAFAEELHRSQFELCSPVNPIGGLFDFARFFDLESGHVQLKHYEIASNDFVDGIGVHVTFGLGELQWHQSTVGKVLPMGGREHFGLVRVMDYA